MIPDARDGDPPGDPLLDPAGDGQPDALVARVETLISLEPIGDPRPWRDTLSELYARYQVQQRLLDRLVRISDQFQLAERERGLDYARRYERKVRQLEKIVRISDRYQLMLTELNARLEFASTHDVLTGLTNRRSMSEQLDREVERASRNGSRFVVAIGDIDRFKTINDERGHAVGDRMLVRIAGTLRDNLREYDGCARWGGEEFLLLFPETPPDQAACVIDRLRAAIASMPPEGDLPPVTISIGYAIFEPGEAIDQTLLRADRALYAAKAAGRNCVRGG